MSSQYYGSHSLVGHDDNTSEHKESPMEDHTEDESSTTSEERDEDSSEEEIDPWIPLIEEAKQTSHTVFEEMKNDLIANGLDEQSASDQANINILPELQKELERIYMQRIHWMKQLKKDPVHKKIMQTKDALIENDDFDPEEALEAAVDKRKFVIGRLVKSYDEENEESED